MSVLYSQGYVYRWYDSTGCVYNGETLVASGGPANSIYTITKGDEVSGSTVALYTVTYTYETTAYEKKQTIRKEYSSATQNGDRAGTYIEYKITRNIESGAITKFSKTRGTV